MKWFEVRRSIRVAAALLALAGCGGGDRPVTPGEPGVVPDTVHVSPDTLAVDLNEADSLTAQLVDEDGVPFNGTVKWIVRDTTKVRRIVTMALTAPILPAATGTTYVLATIPNGVSDSAKVVVTRPPPPSPPTMGRSLYAAPTGSGSACTLAEPCALATALQRAATTGSS